MTQRIMFKNHTGPPAKRKRLVMSCSQCRKKKVKCDKSRPVCSVCEKNGTRDQCSYLQPSWDDISASSPSNDYSSAAAIPMGHIVVNAPQDIPSSQNNDGAVPQELQERQAYSRFPTISIDANTSDVRTKKPKTEIESYLQNELLRLNDKVISLNTNLKLHEELNNPKLYKNRNGIHKDGALDDGDNFISFYVDNEPIVVRAGRVLSLGPLSLGSMFKKDPFLNVSLIKVRKEKANANKNSMIAVNKQISGPSLLKQLIIDDNEDTYGTIREIEQNFKKRLMENEGLDAVSDISNKPFGVTTFTDGYSRDRSGSSLSSRFNQTDFEKVTILSIEETLPDLERSLCLIDRFFNTIFAAFLPFVSEDVIKNRIREIFHEDPQQPSKVKLKILRRFDFAYIAIAMIMMRFVYMSVCDNLLDLQLSKPQAGNPPSSLKSTISDHEKDNTLSNRYIMDFPIGLNFISVAQMCINQFRLLKRGSIPVIQSTLFMRFYHKFAPEEGDGIDGGDSCVFLGMILQMAKSIGLNRDFSKGVEILRSNTKLTNTVRKIWNQIIGMDISLSLNLGNMLLVDENSYDTQLPVISDDIGEDYTNLFNLEIEKSVVEFFNRDDKMYKILRSILKPILNINAKVNLKELIPKLGHLESFISDNFRNITNILTMPNSNISETVKKIYNFKTYTELRISVYSIYFVIFVSKNKNPIFEIFYNLVHIATELLDVLSIMLISTNNGKVNYFDKIFGDHGSQFIIIPSSILVLERCLAILMAIGSRCLDIKYNHKTNCSREFLAVTEELYLKSIAKFDTLKNCTESLSSCYFQAWRVNKKAQFFFSLLNNTDNNIFDRESKVNKECQSGKVPENLNHFRMIPETNELLSFSVSQLKTILDILRDDSYENFIIGQLQRSKRNYTTSSIPNVMQISKILATEDSVVSSKGGSNSQLPTLNPSTATTPTATSATTNTTTSTNTAAAAATVAGSVGSVSTPTSSTSGSTRTPADGFHVNTNSGMSRNEIDQLWYQMMDDIPADTAMYDEEALGPSTMDLLFPFDVFGEYNA